MDEEAELSLSDGDLVPCKRRPVDVGGGVAGAMDLIKGDSAIRETAAIELEDDEELSSGSRHRLWP